MFSLLGALFVGACVIGRHSFRALTRGVLFGVLIGIFGKRNFDMNRVREDVHDKVRDVRRTVKKAVKDAKKEMRDTGKAQRAAWEGRVAERLERAEARKAQESRRTEAAAVPAEPVVMEIPGNGNEALENRELVEELERNVRTAAMAADVPVIEFPEEDDRYFSAKKYGYA